MKLFEFAWCRDYDKKIAALANLCKEKWSFGSNSDHTILKNYISHTFLKLVDEGKVVESPTYSVFNTGLYTDDYEPIFAYFLLNNVPDRQKWVFDNFYTPYALMSLGVAEFPERANYFEDPSAFVFDRNCEIIPQYTHIFSDPENFLRIPETVRESPNRKLLFDGAIKRATEMINANYKTAVPQYYKGRIQLLIPICLLSGNSPDLALVVSKVGNKYMGHTCLTLDMAYNNARLIARPDSSWLIP
jgi:hypothetical protein